MLKKSILSLLLSVSLIQAQQPIILWDIHGVLLHPQDRLLSIVTFPHKWDLLSQVSWPLIQEFGSLLVKNASEDVSSEEYIRIAQKHTNPHLAELIISISNAQAPIPGMKQLVKELHNAGIEQHIGSNIGQTAFRRLLDENKYPYIAPIFSNMDLTKSMVTQFANGEVIKKPDPRYFNQYLTYNGIELHDTPVIFIDDNWKNVEAALKLGFDAILFKSPDQLRAELVKRNIPVAPPRYSKTNQRTGWSIRPGLARVTPIK